MKKLIVFFLLIGKCYGYVDSTIVLCGDTLVGRYINNAFTFKPEGPNTVIKVIIEEDKIIDFTTRDNRWKFEDGGISYYDRVWYSKIAHLGLPKDTIINSNKLMCSLKDGYDWNPQHFKFITHYLSSTKEKTYFYKLVHHETHGRIPLIDSIVFKIGKVKTKTIDYSKLVEFSFYDKRIIDCDSVSMKFGNSEYDLIAPYELHSENEYGDVHWGLDNLFKKKIVNGSCVWKEKNKSYISGEFNGESYDFFVYSSAKKYSYESAPYNAKVVLKEVGNNIFEVTYRKKKKIYQLEWEGKYCFQMKRL